MSGTIRAPRAPETVMKSYTVRPDQVESIEILATKVDRHFNRSQVVRDALDYYITRNSAAIRQARDRDALDTSHITE